MTYMRSWKSHRLTSHTWLCLNPQIGRPLSRIVGAIALFFFNTKFVSHKIALSQHSIVFCWVSGFPLFLSFVTQENRGNLKIHQKLMLVLLYKKNYWNLKIKLIIQLNVIGCK
jgi:hypothetical protein